VLGLIARAENRNDDALRFFERVRQIDPRDIGTLVNEGQIYLQDGKYAEAIALLRSAVADEPYNVTAVYSLGLALTRAGQRDEGSGCSKARSRFVRVMP
jgi:Flp pilus assembly protein TadD